MSKVVTMTVTIVKGETAHLVKVTQRLNEFDVGYYFGYIEDMKGNVLDTFSSSNVKDPITLIDLNEHFERFLNRSLL